MKTNFGLLAILLLLLGSGIASAKRNDTGFVCKEAVSASPSCYDVASLLVCGGVGGCRFDPVDDINEACLNNVNGHCLSQSCKILNGSIGNQNCSNLEDIQAIAPFCQGVCDFTCTQAACESYGCFSAQRIGDVNLACSGAVSGECVRRACESSDCSELASLQAATRTCGSKM